MRININEDLQPAKYRFAEKGINITCDNIICTDKDDCFQCIFYETEIKLKDLIKNGRVILDN